MDERNKRMAPIYSVWLLPEVDGQKGARCFLMVWTVQLLRFVSSLRNIASPFSYSFNFTSIPHTKSSSGKQAKKEARCFCIGRSVGGSVGRFLICHRHQMRYCSYKIPSSGPLHTFSSFFFLSLLYITHFCLNERRTTHFFCFLLKFIIKNSCLIWIKLC